MNKDNDFPSMQRIAAILTDETANSFDDVVRRCKALEQLAASGLDAYDTLPAIMRSLVVGVSVDCVLALRVAAAEAAWKVGGRRDLALPFLAWALKDEYWGVARKAAEVLFEMGPIAHAAVPDLISLAERRLDNGPFHFESFDENGKPLLAIVASALGVCGRGTCHRDAANQTLIRITNCDDNIVRAAAWNAIEQLMCD